MLAMSEKKFAMNKGRRRRKTGYPNHTSRDRRKDLHPVAMRGPVVPTIVHRPTPSPGFFRDSPIYHRKNAQKILPFFPGMEGVRWCTEGRRSYRLSWIPIGKMFRIGRRCTIPEIH